MGRKTSKHDLVGQSYLFDGLGDASLPSLPSESILLSPSSNTKPPTRLLSEQHINSASVLKNSDTDTKTGLSEELRAAIPPHASPLFEPRRNQLQGIHEFFQDQTSNFLYIDSTGGGKTAVELSLASHIISQGKRVILMTATGTLKEQHTGKAQQLFDFPEGSIASFEGGNLGARKKLYEDQTKRIFISTQCIGADLWEGDLPHHDIGVLMVDEAHMMRGDHAFKRAVDFCNAHHIPIVFFTATPGDTSEEIDSILKATGKVAKDREYDARTPQPYKHRQRYVAPFEDAHRECDNRIVTHAQKIHDRIIGISEDLLSRLKSLDHEITVYVKPKSKKKKNRRNKREVERTLFSEQPEDPQSPPPRPGYTRKCVAELVAEYLKRDAAMPGSVMSQLLKKLSDLSQKNLSKYVFMTSLVAELGLWRSLHHALHCFGENPFLDAGARMILDHRFGHKLNAFERRVLSSDVFSSAYREIARGKLYENILTATDFPTLFKELCPEENYQGRSFSWCVETMQDALILDHARSYAPEHPQDIAVSELIRFHIRENRDARFLFFTQLNSHAKFLAERVNRRFSDGDLVWNDRKTPVNAAPFLGNIGLTKSERDEVIAKFHTGEINVLFSTSALELGQDVPGLTVVGILDQTTEPKRIGQREGRGGRKADHNNPNKPTALIYYIITPGTEGEKLYYIGLRKHQKMNAELGERSRQLHEDGPTQAA